MLTFQNYDFFRLNKFKIRKANIDFGETSSFSYYRFEEVDYFNYILFYSNNYDESDLKKILSEYLKDGKEHIKFIFPANEDNKYPNIINETVEPNKIVCLKNISKQQLIIENIDQLLSPVIDQEDLLEYTRIYLEGFDSEVKEVSEVAKNFSHLNESSRVDFFFVKYNGNIVGICSNYYCEDHVFLSACAILPPYRNIGLQKKAIKARISISQRRGYSVFTSWAYMNGISHNNLLNTGFSNYQLFNEYISKPLEHLTETCKTLSV